MTVPTAETFTRPDGLTVTLYLGDCLDVLPTLAAGSVDAVITDPPYGMNLNTDFSGFNGWNGKGHKYERIIGDDKSFNPAPLLEIGKIHVLFGAQYYCHKLPERGGWVVFNKRGNGKPSEICFGDCELAWTDVGSSVRMYTQMWHGVSRWSMEGSLHPAQKPIGLMSWLIERYTEPLATVLDAYMGSGTTGVAAVKLGRSFIGIEKEPKYYEIARRRILEALAQPALFQV